MHFWNSTSLLQPRSVLNKHKRVDTGFFHPLICYISNCHDLLGCNDRWNYISSFSDPSISKKNFKIFKYVIALFMVGFSLALPLYLYDNESFERLN